MDTASTADQLKHQQQVLSVSLDRVHRRLDALEQCMESMPDRICHALQQQQTGHPLDGAAIFNVVVQAISASVLQSVTTALHQPPVAPPAPRPAQTHHSIGSVLTTPHDDDDDSPIEQNGPASTTTALLYNAVPMHHLSTTSPPHVAASSPPLRRLPALFEPPTRSVGSLTPRASPPSPAHHRVVGKEFVWPDGTKRRAPHAWQFPINSCRDMWRCWFWGDADAEIGPYRLLKSRDVTYTNCVKNMSNARVVIHHLVHTAIDHGVIDSIDALESTLSCADCVAVFDRAFDLYAGKGVDGQYTREGFERLRPEEAATVKYSSVYERQRKRRRHDATTTQQPSHHPQSENHPPNLT
ncbi:Aste57867_12134 [Aphanomyces stellatus]|uniref:Aste57867_12134 protein n=1 Tax=Aphanomyces stellatus TaxID=120398 RepID=A0A485KWR8_9STRA|nr:hypothetical protein As57867_012089 [Aphanomyces stellatus]VFT88988.1 Aste57867_12134 [Aphanomyces stellatus]